MIPSDGSGNTWVKIVNGSVVLGAGASNKVLVTSHDTIINADIQASGGFPHAYQFVRMNVLQETTPFMTSSIVQFSGTAGAGNGNDFRFLRLPLPNAGSVVSLTLLTQGMTIKSGSLSGTVVIDGTPTLATVGMNTGSIATAFFAKDSVSFAANSYIELQLTASSGYLTDLNVTSGSLMGMVVVEY